MRRQVVKIRSLLSDVMKTIYFEGNWVQHFAEDIHRFGGPQNSISRIWLCCDTVITTIHHTCACSRVVTCSGGDWCRQHHSLSTRRTAAGLQHRLDWRAELAARSATDRLGRSQRCGCWRWWYVCNDVVAI